MCPARPSEHLISGLYLSETVFKSQISMVAKGAAGAAEPINGNDVSLLNCQYLTLLLAWVTGADI